MPTTKTSTHLVNNKGAIICQNKTGTYKAKLEAWEKLSSREQCGNCRRVLARMTGKERVNFGTIHKQRKHSTDDPRTSYTPRHGQLE